MELKHRDRIVQLKIVYYGPAVGGKTTNLQMLHAAAEKRHRGEFISVSSAQDRTILFDLLPLKGVGFHGFEIRFQLVAVPGQSAYAATRRLVMRGADAVVFVANSAADRLEENVASVREMAEHLVANGLDPATVPLVFQHNKRDLPKVISSDELDNALNFRDAPYWPAVAIQGEGVMETLGGILEQTMESLIGRYRSLALPPEETVQNWTWEMLHQVFGGPSLARKKTPDKAPPEEDRRLVKVSVPRPKTGPMAAVSLPPATPAAKPPVGGTGLAEKYAQASLDLGQALEQTREELDEARRRLEELEHTLNAIKAVEEGSSPQEALQNALNRIAVGGGCRGATLLGVGADRAFRLVTGVGLKQDPVLRHGEGPAFVRQRLVPLRKPALLKPNDSPELAAAVAPLDPPVKAVAAVPVRSALGLHGLVMLYYGRTDPLPSNAVLSHLNNMARVLAAWFSVRRAAAVSASAESFRRTLPQIESAAKAALVLVQEAVQNPQVAASSLEKVARTLEAMVTLTAELAQGPPRAAGKPPRGR